MDTVKILKVWYINLESNESSTCMESNSRKSFFVLLLAYKLQFDPFYNNQIKKIDTFTNKNDLDII